MINIAVFASGTGSNAVNFYKHFKDHPSISISKIYCNNPNAGIIEKSKSIGIECLLFTRDDWNSGKVTKLLIENKTDFIVLAGFLWLVPQSIIQSFPDRIINIHPALLPNYGGKGMYGMKVHESIIADKQEESGISIHLVNEHYDKGNILFQKKLKLTNGETPASLAEKIHELEYKYYPQIVEDYIVEYQKAKNLIRF